MKLEQLDSDDSREELKEQRDNHNGNVTDGFDLHQAGLIDHLSGLGSSTETLAPHPAGGEGGLDEEKQGEHGQGRNDNETGDVVLSLWPSSVFPFFVIEQSVSSVGRFSF